MAKKKLKKFLKSVAPLAIAGLGAAMLGNRKNKRNQMNKFLATEGGDLANLDQIGRAIEMRDDNTAVLAPSRGFDYLQENEDLGNAKSIKNSTVFNFKDQSSFEFNASKNLKTDFTEYYNFIYKYKSDCLSADFSYNKTFYKDTNLKPDESLMFTIRFIPFAEIIGSADTLINN